MCGWWNERISAIAAHVEANSKFPCVGANRVPRSRMTEVQVPPACGSDGKRSRPFVATLLNQTAQRAAPRLAVNVKPPDSRIRTARNAPVTARVFLCPRTDRAYVA